MIIKAAADESEERKIVEEKVRGKRGKEKFSEILFDL